MASRKKQSTEHNDVNIRFLHNVQGAPNVNVYLNDKSIALNLKYQDLTSYLRFKNGKTYIKVTTTDGKELISTKMMLESGENYTLVVAGNIADLKIQPLSFIDANSCPNLGYADIRFIHAVYGAPNVDVYLESQKIFNNVAFGNTGNPEYLPLKLGTMTNGKFNYTYAVTVKKAGTNTIVVGPLQLSFNSGGLYTIFASGSVSKGLSAVFSYDNNGECEVLKKDFDPQRYMGKWYQIASIPQFFSQDCVRSTAEYTLLNNGINVFNTCYNKDNKVVRSITGNAVIVNQLKPAALRVSFPNQPNTGGEANYLVQMTDYDTYSVVGSSNRNSLYILARENSMSKSDYEKILRNVKKLGYDINNIKVDHKAVY